MSSQKCILLSLVERRVRVGYEEDRIGKYSTVSQWKRHVYGSEEVGWKIRSTLKSKQEERGRGMRWQPG